MTSSAVIAADELVQIVDRDNRPTGSVPRRVMRQQRLIHRATYIFVYNQAGHLFVQKRTLTKDIFPGFWDLAAGGVVLADEADEQSARRELAEELGVAAPLEFLFHHYYQSALNRVWGAVFRCHHEGPFTLQASEITWGEFLSVKDIRLRSANEPFTPDALEIFGLLHPANQVGA